MIARDVAGKARSPIASHKIEKADEKMESCCAKSGERVGSRLVRVRMLAMGAVRVIAELGRRVKRGCTLETIVCDCPHLRHYLRLLSRGAGVV